jgi:hypothetical protein
MNLKNNVKGKSPLDFQESLIRLMQAPKRFDDHDFFNALKDIIGGYRGFYFKGMSIDCLSRARKHGKSEFTLDNYDLVLAPNPKNPKIKINKGRFNLQNESVLYTSTHPIGALMEVNPEIGDVITICQLEKIAKIPNAMVIGTYKMADDQLFSTILKTLNEGMAKLDGNEKENVQLINMMIDYLCSCKSDEVYKVLTAFFKLGIFYSDINCLIYPSLFYQLNEFSLCPVNFVFRYGHYLDYLKPTKYSRLEILNVQYTHFIKVQLTHEGVALPNGDIYWTELKNPEINHYTDIHENLIDEFLEKYNLVLHN